MNLITNAVEAYGEESGIVLVSAGLLHMERGSLSSYLLAEELPVGDHILLEVSDTGCGMNKETKKKIFGPFFSTKFTGRGLGMASVMGIIRGHCGAIQVSSKPNRGTTVKVLLPLNRVECNEFTDVFSDERSSFQEQGVVLLVDDEQTVREIGKQMLERIGFTVLSAVDGMDAVHQVRTHANELVCVLLDLNMPKMAGLKAFSEIRRIRSDLPVILCSGYNQQATNNSFTDMDLTGFLHKPFLYQSLVDALQDILK